MGKASVLVVGGDGRANALVWKLYQSPHVGKMYCAPGNPGIAAFALCIANAAKTADDLQALAKFAVEKAIDFTVVSPEGPLIGNHVGIVDIFRSRQKKIFGPPRAGALIEGDKAFCMRLCEKYGIPTPRFAICGTADEAKGYARGFGLPVVIKNNWPRAGKGVTIADTYKMADFAINEICFDPEQGGPPVVIQEFLEGLECSVIAVTDGKTVLTLAPARDYKDVSRTDKRKTGGMASYSPVEYVNEVLLDDIKCKFLERAVQALAAEGIEYRGALYAGLKLTSQGPKLLEFNCRFGDPETQAMLPRFEGDLFELLMAATDGTLASYKNFRWLLDACVCLVMASGGYPDSKLDTGHTITGVEKAATMDRVVVFHAGTAYQEGRLVNISGRVLGVTAIDHTLADAANRAYRAVEQINFEGAWWRDDIGS